MKQLLLTFSLILFMGCSEGHSFSRTGFNSTFEETDSFSNYLIIKNENTDIKLNISVELKSGSSKINIVNPQNEVVETFYIIELGKTEINRSFKPIKGKWTLLLESSDAVGSFDLKWTNE